jgi:hypothetical protein
MGVGMRSAINLPPERLRIPVLFVLDMQAQLSAAYCTAALTALRSLAAASIISIA